MFSGHRFAVGLHVMAWMLVLAGVACAQTDGVLYRQDFETSTTEKLPDPWSIWVRDDTKAVLAYADGGAAHSGAQALSLSNMTGTRAQYVAILPLPEGLSYLYASVWVKTALPAGATNSGPLQLQISDPNGWRILGISEPATEAPEWTQLEVVGAVPAGTKSIAVELMCLGALPGKAWFDDVELRPVTELPNSLRSKWRPRLSPAAAAEVPPTEALLGISLPFLTPTQGGLTNEDRYRCRVHILDSKDQPVGTTESPIHDGMAEIYLAKLPPGDGIAVLQVVTNDTGGEVVSERRQPIHVLSPAEVAVKGRRLNNLVVELVSRRVKLKPGAKLEAPFALQGDGWVYLAVKPLTPGSTVQATEPGFLGDQPIPMVPVGSPPVLETMRWMGGGNHRLILTADRAAEAEVVVRTVPELLYARFDYPPLLKEYDPCDRAFLDKHILPNVNGIIIGETEGRGKDLAELRRQGKKWLTDVPVPGLNRWKERSKLTSAAEISAFDAATPLRLEDVLRTWGGAGMTHPDLGGSVADEFWPTLGKYYDVYGAALEQLHRQHPDRQFYAYGGPPRTTLPDHWHFLEALLQRGGRLAYTTYALSQPTEEQAREYLLDFFVRLMALPSEALIPGSLRSTLYCISTMDTIGACSFQQHPEVDWKFYMDMQFAFMVRNPEFYNLYGVHNWTSGYASDENLRWLGQLYRHYGIEGHRDLLSKQYGYSHIPGHLRNGDFTEGLRGWELSAAEEGTVQAGSHPGYGLIQGRSLATPTVGANFLVLKRSAGKPNVVRQKLTGLVPGRAYMLRLVVADLADLKSGKSKGKDGQRYTLTTTLSKASTVADKSFVHVGTTWRFPQAPFVGDNPFCLNLHQVVFRPEQPQVELRLSDWASATEPGGPAGQELIVNYVQVLPYFEGAARD